MSQELLPRDLTFLIARHAPQHAAERGLTPAAIWLWHPPEVMLSMKVRSLSRSAKARLSSKLPLAANLAGAAVVFIESFQTQGCAPVTSTAPE